MYTPTFQELAGDEQTFFTEFFNQKPNLRRKALSGDPREILSIADLDEILHHEAIRTPYVRLTKGGAAVLETSYTRSMRVQGEYVTDCIVPEHVYEHFQSGATITWNSMNHFRPNLRELTAMLGEKFAVRSDVIAFLTPAGRQGFSPHYDPVDLFIVQLEGTKYWKLWPPPDIRKGDVAHFKLEQLGDPLFEVTMEPGDVLYLPYNTPHVAAAENQMSLHLSVMVRPRMWGELLKNTVEQIVNDDPVFWQFPYLNEASFDEQAMALKQGVAALVERLFALNPSDQIRRLADQGRKIEGATRQGQLFQDSAAVDGAGATSVFMRTPISLSLLESVEDKTTMVVNGTTLKVPTPVGNALSEMGETGRVPAGKFFPGVPVERSVEAAKSLARLGVLRLVP